MRFFNICFILIFFIMLALPFVFVDLKSDRISVRENRMLANRPSFADIKNNPVLFKRQFDEWFKDSTGFREKLLAIYRSVNDNSWLNNVVNNNGYYAYLVGENGHYFFSYADGSMISKFQGRKFISDEQLSGMAKKLEEVKTYLDKKGIPFVVMFCADKESIYPEFYPKTIKRGPEPIQLDVITNYLKEHTSVDVFNIRQALLAEKDNYLLYHFTNDVGHYNQIGAFFAYRELMKHINIYFPKIKPFELEDIEINYNNNVQVVSFKADKTYKELDSSFFDDVDLIRPFSWENVIFENTKPDLPVILFIRDSFASESFFGKYIAQQFGKAIFIHFLNMEHFKEYIEKYKPNIVVFESAESSLRRFTDYVNNIPILLDTQR